MSARFVSVGSYWTPIIRAAALPNIVESNKIWLLLEGGLGLTAVPHNWQVIGLDVAWPVNWNTHHSELVTQPFNHFRSRLHRWELRPKGRCFNWWLLLAVAKNWRSIEKDQDSSARSPRYFVPGVLGISVRSHLDGFAQGFRSVLGNLLFDVLIKVRPVRQRLASKTSLDLSCCFR